MSSLISIITPTYNRYDLVQTCIKETTKQTYVPTEHIVVDDGSSDATCNICNIIHLPQQRGAAKARNVGVNNSHGEYITFVDDDDILYPWHCQALYEAIQGCDFVHAIADKVRGGRPIGQWTLTSATIDLRERNFIPLCTVMLSRKAWDLVGGMDENLPFYQDWDLWLRLQKVGIRPKHIDVATSKIFYHLDTITSKRTVEETIAVRDFILKRSK